MNVRLYFNHLDFCFGVLYSPSEDFVDPIGHSYMEKVAAGWGDYTIPWGYNPLNRSAEYLYCFSRKVAVEQ